MDGEHTTLEQDGPLRSSHKSGHMTARTQRIELITRGERRRRWSIEEKREIVAESLRPGLRIFRVGVEAYLERAAHRVGADCDVVAVGNEHSGC